MIRKWVLEREATHGERRYDDSICSVGCGWRGRGKRHGYRVGSGRSMRAAVPQRPQPVPHHVQGLAQLRQSAASLHGQLPVPTLTRRARPLNQSCSVKRDAPAGHPGGRLSVVDHVTLAVVAGRFAVLRLDWPVAPGGSGFCHALSFSKMSAKNSMKALTLAGMNSRHG